MARYEHTFSGERRTRLVGVKFTPSEYTSLEAAAEAQGQSLSSYIRDLTLYRAAASVAAARHHPDAKELLYQLNAVGNNLNQLARRAHIHGELPERHELDSALDLLKIAIARVLAL